MDPVNPPQVKPITLTRRAQIPAGMLPERGLTLRQLEEQDSHRAGDQAPTYRPRDETPEERRARKEAVKQERRVSSTGPSHTSGLSGGWVASSDSAHRG